MARYVDAEVAETLLNKAQFTESDDYFLGLCAAEDIIHYLSEANVAPVVHAKWVKKKHLIPLAWDSDPFIWDNYDEETHSEWKEYWHCSECDYEADRSMKPKFKYCPECGAKMDKEEE